MLTGARRNRRYEYVLEGEADAMDDDMERFIAAIRDTVAVGPRIAD